MLSFQETKKVIFDAVKSPGTETISVRESIGRVLAEDLAINRDYPDTRLSAVDGYALRFGSNREFSNIGVVAAGHFPDFTLNPGECAAVMTGASVPEGTDCVARVEDCQEKEKLVVVSSELKPGDLINETAYEAASGDPFAQCGVPIKHSLYPALFYAGISTVRVFKKPKIGILMTGDEIREVEDGPAKGQVFNTNLYIIESILHSLGLKWDYHERIPDDEVTTRKTLEAMTEKCDFIISSGGVSMGKYDYIKKTFGQADFSILIKGTPIKPGRPLMVAKRNEKLFFGIPGYPAAFLVNALLYLVPALKKASGYTNYENQLINVQMKTPMRSRKGKLYLNRAIIELEDGEWVARDVGSQKTSHFLNFSKVNGLVFMPENIENLEIGASAQALHFNLEL